MLTFDVKKIAGLILLSGMSKANIFCRDMIDKNSRNGHEV